MVRTSTPGRGQRRGIIAVLMAACLVVLLGMVAIAVDGGGLLAERQRTQAAADAAASAAATDLFYNYWTNQGADAQGTARSSALTNAAANGYANDGVQSTVTVNIPPRSGDYAGQPSYAEVIVQYNFKRGFSAVFGSGTIPVRARAVARGAPVASEAGILVLDPTLKGALNAQGSGHIRVEHAAVIDDSAHPQGGIAGGGGSLTAPLFKFTGDYTTTGGGSFTGEIRT